MGSEFLNSYLGGNPPPKVSVLRKEGSGSEEELSGMRITVSIHLSCQDSAWFLLQKRRPLAGAVWNQEEMLLGTCYTSRDLGLVVSTQT